MTERKPIKLRLEDPYVRATSLWHGNSAKVVLTAYKKRRDGTWQEYEIVLDYLTMQNLACVGRTMRRTVVDMGIKQGERYAEAMRSITGER